MKLFTNIIALSLLIFSSSILITAQETPELKWKIGGTIQAMASYAQTASDTFLVGFGIRRARLKTYFSYGDVSAFIQYSAKSNKLLDARITYKFSDAVNFRIGRFVGAGVRSGGLTSHTKIDIIERPMSAFMWSINAIGTGDYRDYGIAFLGKVDDFSYNLTLSNGNGNQNITPSQIFGGWYQSQSLSISGMVSFKPKAIKGLETGGYYGIGNKYFNDYSSYNAYIYWEPKPIRIKAEIISVTKNGNTEVTSLGYYLFAAYGFTPNWEALFRYEKYDSNTDIDGDAIDLITIGARYALFPQKLTAGKITFAYVIHNEEEISIDNDVFYIMFQTAF